ncbi:glycosyltransferase [Paenibacillus alkaliterrae]|uniref:glycosyltransferase n=1 Tax=Paenibacillus alkaliterrae TaxID=320909 RepID=UPI001F1B9AB8|nr:glycosyltransferase [Paenibacillus alkaliterrae]MCF2938561.1 glycosyltransferase [Paenibacillus alkaliterrae]
MKKAGTASELTDRNESKGVTIITSTNRPECIRNLFENFKRQKWEVKELIVILNNDRMSIGRYKRQSKNLGHVSIYQLSEKWPLGKCLNYGIGKARHEIIAKFDDDDYYSPLYLSEAMKKFDRTDADIIGKHKFYMYFKQSAKLMLAKMPSKNRVAGATIMFKKKMYPGVSFSDLRKGSDMRFLKDSLKKGYRMESTGPHHFAVIRRANQRTHTWKVSDRTIRLLRAKTITRTKRFQEMVNR